MVPRLYELFVPRSFSLSLICHRPRIIVACTGTYCHRLSSSHLELNCYHRPIILNVLACLSSSNAAAHRTIRELYHDETRLLFRAIVYLLPIWIFQFNRLLHLPNNNIILSIGTIRFTEQRMEHKDNNLHDRIVTCVCAGIGFSRVYPLIWLN